MYDPSIGQESLTAIDVVGVLIGHVLIGIMATLLIDWSWIPLSPEQRRSGRSLQEIKRTWGWEEKTDEKADIQAQKTEKS